MLRWRIRACYELLRRVYAEVAHEGSLDVRDAIRHVDEHGLGELNAGVEQKET